MQQTIDEYLKYLDDILLYFKDKAEGKATYSELFENQFGKKFEHSDPMYDTIPIGAIESTGENDLSFDWMESENTKINKFHSALDYLSSLKLLIFKNSNYYITFEGHMKIAFTFVSEYEKNQEDKKLRDKHLKTSTNLSRMQRWTIWISVVLAALAIVVSVFSFLKKGNNTYYNCRSSHHKLESKPEIERNRVVKVKSNLYK